ncbi:MAG: quinone-dependent dihydroorotate dehydrogenase [Verrucomicrobiota bacterium]|nr:quinone-dependent dihydroorotate dehydrogenase [Verrucomicrobiota bacterium]
MIYRNVIRPLLFMQDAEKVHERTIDLLKVLGPSGFFQILSEGLFKNAGQPIKLWGLTFKNAVGLAAGLDKNGVAIPAWQALGFGFVEVGTVTAHAQSGNEKPRLFRLVKQEAVINRMGFNNVGAVAMAETLKKMRTSFQQLDVPVGINLGKSKVTPLENASDDYVYSLQTLYSVADYFVINVSSPNTPGLRQLQDKPMLNDLLKAVQRKNYELGLTGFGGGKPMLLKIAPDLTEPQIDEVLELMVVHNMNGIIATNTTIDRSSLPSSAPMASENGGLSGKPLQQKSTQVIKYIRKRMGTKLPIIGVGGIFSHQDFMEKMEAGASLVQVYTGLIYEGPALVKKLLAQ